MRFIDEHMCKFCRRRPDEDGLSTTVDYNGCKVAMDIFDDCSGRYSSEWDGNDREFREDGRLVFKTIDNGGGYNIVKCPSFRLDYQKYIESDEWKEVRNDRIFLDGYKCRMCGSAMNLVVHHITYERVPNEDMDDLITLCRDCHNRLHERDNERKGRSFHLPYDYQKR